MAGPSPSWDTVRVYGTWRNPATGLALTGKIRFTFPTRVVSLTDDVIFPAGFTVEATLNNLGQVSANLPAVNDPDNFPAIWDIQVAEVLDDTPNLTYTIRPLIAHVLSGFNLRTAYTGEDPAVASDSTPPAAPTNVAGSSLAPTSFVLTWTAPTDNVGVYGYEVQIGGTVYATPTSPTVTVTGRTAATAYLVRVRARDAAGNWSALSAPVTVTTPAVATETIFTTQTPVVTNATDGQGITAGLRFSSDVDGTVTGMRFYRAVTSPTSVIGQMYSDSGSFIRDGAAVTSPTTGWNTVTFTSPVSITAGTIYRIGYWTNGPYVYTSAYLPVTVGHLTAIDGRYGYGSTPIYPNALSANTAYFADVQFTPAQSSATVPSTPAAPTGVAGSTKIALSWPAPASGGSPITGYDVQQFVGATAGAVTSTLTNSVTIGSLTNGTAYTFKVRARNAVGNSAYSAASAALTPAVATSTFPNATTTGVPAGTTLTAYTGPATITTAGLTIDSKFIDVGLVIQADNVTISNCLIRSSGYYFMVLNDGGHTGLVVQDCEIDGLGNTAADSCVAGGNFTLTRCSIHGTTDGVKAGSNVVVQDSYIHDLAVTSQSHNDGVQSLGTTALTIQHNTIILGTGSTSAVILSTGSATDMRNILIDNNLVGGGAYTIYGGYQAGVDVLSRVSNITISNNKFSTQIYPNSGAFGPLASVDPPDVVSGNTWYDGPNVGNSVP